MAEKIKQDTPVIEEIVQDPPVQPKKVAKVVRPVPVIEAVEPRYKLTAYTSNGTVKSNINGGIFMDMCRRHGDIIRSISTSRLMTIDDICVVVWNYERKMQFPSNRTKKSIQTAVDELVEKSFVTKR